MERYFNIAGPCVPGKHYMIPALERLPEVARLIDREQSFVIHAARQSGKMTALMALVRAINENGEKRAVAARCVLRIRPISPLSHLAFHVWRLMSRGRIPGARRWTRDAEKPATNHLTTHPPKESNQ